MPEPSAAALRAAGALPAHWMSMEDMARIIDRETGLPELLEALEEIAALPTDNTGLIMRGIARAAIAKATQVTG